MKDATDYLFALSDDELVIYHRLFHEYPTHDRNQRKRLHSAVAAERKRADEAKCGRRKKLAAA